MGIQKVKDWLKNEEPIDYSNRKCVNCSFGQNDKCDLNLKEECVTATSDETHRDWWADKDEEETEEENVDDWAKYDERPCDRYMRECIERGEQP